MAFSSLPYASPLGTPVYRSAPGIMGTPLSTARIWNLFRKRQHQRRGVQEGIDVHRDKAFFGEWVSYAWCNKSFSLRYHLAFSLQHHYAHFSIIFLCGRRSCFCFVDSDWKFEYMMYWTGKCGSEERGFPSIYNIWGGKVGTLKELQTFLPFDLFYDLCLIVNWNVS